MMSIFSSFDALSAESFGQKVGFSWGNPPPVQTKQAPPPLPSSVKKEQAADKSKRPENQEPQRQQRRGNPRFAPELDGVFCFETIIPS